MKRKLYRSRTDAVLTGVLGGLAAYTETDATIWRLLFVVFVIVTGFFPGVLIYLAAILILPKEPASSVVEDTPAAGAQL